MLHFVFSRLFKVCKAYAFVQGKLLKKISTLKKIVVSRTDSIGDVVLTLPLVGLLKQLIPGCEVIFLCKSYTQSVVSCCPNVNGVINFDELSALPQPQQVEALRALQADCIIHVFPNKQIARAAKLARIPLRIGTTNRIFHWTTCNKLVRLSRKKSPLHEAQLNLVLAQPLGAKKCYSLNEAAALLAFSAKNISFPAKELIDTKRFNLVLHPKSKGSAREWGVDNFARLVELLPRDKFNIFITGTAQEGGMVRSSLMEKCKGKITDLTGQLSLDELIAFLSGVDGVAAASTGPLHLGAALGIHAVGLYPPIRPMHPGRWAPIGKNVKVFAAQKECNVCRKTQDCACMRSITPESVAAYLASVALVKKER